MNGGSVQLRTYRIARRDGKPTEIAAQMAGIGITEAKLIDADDAKHPPGPECFEPIEPSPLKEIDMPQPESQEEILHDAKTGEILETRAADGTQRYPSVTTLTDLIFMLGDGQFNADKAHDLREFSEAMEEAGIDAGGKVKGKIVIEIDVERQHDGVYFFTPGFKTKVPTVKEGRTIGWVTPDNRFTPNKPNQGNLFGTVRDVSADRNIRN